MANYMLVSFKTCPWVQRSAIILREKNEPFEFRHIESDNRPDWFLAISPHKKVPVLRIDDKVTLFESNAINEYLDEVVSPQLHPKDPIQRAINRAWTDYVPTFASNVTGCAYAATQEAYEAAIAKIPDTFERLEKALAAQGSGPFFNGANPDQFTVFFTLDVTPKATGKRITLEEVAIYTVNKRDQITREQFFYEGAH